MAIGLKLWSGLVAVALLGVGLWALPPSQLRFSRPDVLPEVRAYNELEAEVRRELGVLLATQWSDSLSGLAVREAVDGLAIGLPPQSEVSAAALASLEERLRTRLDELEPRDERFVVGVFFQSAVHGRPEGLPNPFSLSAQTYVGELDGTPYCLQVLPEGRVVTDRRISFTDGLGECRWYAKYGLPGTEVGRWLEGGGLRFAGGAERPELPPRASAPEDWMMEIEGPAFGLRRHPAVDELPAAGRCLAGQPDACVSVVLGSEPVGPRDAGRVAYVVRNSPMTYSDRWGSATWITWMDRFLLSDVEQEFGAEAFGRFWASDEPVPRAFESAFGVELGVWMQDWAQREVGVHRAGPGLQSGTPLWSLLTLMLLGAAASVVATRRRVA